MKRILAFMLAFVMLLGMIPVAYATEAEELPVEIPVAEQPAPETEPATEATEPVVEENEPVAEAAEPVTEETEPVPEVTEPVTEETEPVEKIESAPVQKAETEEPAIIAQGTCGANATWVFYDNDSLVISGTGAMDDYSESNPAPWNTWNDMIRTVKISDGITKVGAYSFNEECSRMYTLDLGSTVSVVGEYAFYGVPLFDLTLPDSVVSLGDYAFCGGGPDSIDRDVSIGSGLAEMGECALYCGRNKKFIVSAENQHFTAKDDVLYSKDMSTLYCYPAKKTAETYQVDAGTKRIAVSAFEAAWNLKKVTLPQNLTAIEDRAFYDCYQLADVSLPDSVTELGEYVYSGTAITEIAFPATYTKIPAGVCCSCDQLQKVTLPEGLLTIGKYAFSMCEQLKSIRLPEGIQVLENSAFSSCEILEEVNFPDSLTTIGNNAFQYDALQEAILPDSITYLGEFAFASNTELTKIRLPAGLKEVKRSLLSGAGLTSVDLPESIEVIEGTAFMGSNITSLTIPAKVKAIGSMCFLGCNDLEFVKFLGDAPGPIEEGKTPLENAFYRVTTTVYYPQGNATWDSVINQDYGGTLTWVPYAPPCDHTTLTPVSAKESTCIEQGYPAHLICTCGQRFLEDGVTKIALEDILLPLTEHDYRNGSCTGCGGALPFNYYADTSTGTVMLHNYTGTETDVIVPAYVDGYPVTRLESTFCGCSQLKSVVLPDTLIIVGASAFSDCENLTALVIPEGVTEISWSAFQNCKKLESVALPSTLVSLGDFAFTDCCGLKRVEIPAGIQKIADGTFSGCTGLTQVTIPERVTQIGTMAFSGCSKLESVVLPDSITAIGSAAFQYCTALKEISLPAELTEITSMLFVGCASLPSVQLPAGVTAIANSAFSDCSGLEYISIPKTTTFIGTRAFYNCSALKCVSFAGTEEEAKDISVGTGNAPLTNAQWHYEGGCCTPQISVSLDADTQKPLISWELRPCLGQYAIFRGEDPDNMEEQIGVTSEGFWLDETAPHNGCYYMVFGTTLDETGGAASAPRNLDGKLIAPKVSGESVPYSGKPVISWNSVYGAVKYEVYRATSATGKYSKVKTTTETSYLDSSASAAKTYFYKVKAIAKTSSKNGPLSEYISVPCLCAQPAVTIKLNTATGTPELSWKKISGATKYEILRASEESEGYFEVITTQTGTTFKDVTAPPDQECAYVVVAHAKDPIYSSAIPELQDRPAIRTGLGQPVVTSASDAATGLPVISWNAVGGAAEYEISRSTKSSGTYEVIGTTGQLSFMDDTAPAGKTNYYKVTAISVLGTRSAASAYKSAKRVCTAPVISITNDAPTGKPQVIWEAVEGAKKYEVYRATSETGKYSKVTTTSALSYTDSKASLGKFYYYKVKAVASSSTYNSGFSDTMARLTICGQPKLTASLDAATGKPVLTWSKVTGAKNYVLLCAAGNGTFKTCVEYPGAGKFVHEDATTDTTYRYKILAKGEAYELDSLDAAEPVSVTAVCGQPVVTVTTHEVSGKPRLSWEKVEGAAEYEVTRSTKSSGTYEYVCATEGLSIIDSTADGGKTWYYKVTAISFKGNSGAASAYKSAKSVCARPTVVMGVDFETGKPSLKWNGVSGAKKYEIYRATKATGKYSKIATVTKLSYVDTKAPAAATSYYKVRAVASSSSYNSPYAEGLSAPSLCARPVVTLKLNAATGQPQLSWKKVTGAVGYAIFRATEELGEYVPLGVQTGLTFQDTTALLDGTCSYVVVAKAADSLYDSYDSYAPTVVITCGQPVVTAASDEITGKPVLTWDAVAGAEEYIISRATKSSGTYAEICVTDGQYFMDYEAAVGKTYYYKVTALSPKGNPGAASAYKSAKCVVAAPEISVTLNEKVKPVISWEAEEGAKKYEVYRATSENGKYTKLTTTTKLSYTDSKASSGKTYYYKVKAVASSSSYNSAYSNIAGITVAPLA